MIPLFKIIYEDDELLIIDKPAGLRVDTEPTGLPSVEDSLNFDIERHGIVHRIDKNTSGLLIVAKTNGSLENLKKQFQNHLVTKVYTNLVLGKTEGKETIELPIARDPSRKQAMRALNYISGKERGRLRDAVTHYKLKERYLYNKNQLSLLETNIETGRTHQIRAHMQAIGHPIIGDQMYKNKTSKKISKELNLERQFLHASQIEFTHPAKAKKLVFNSPLPSDLATVLKELTLDEDRQ